VDELDVVQENMIRRQAFQLFAVAALALFSGCVGTELARTPTHRTDREIERMIHGEWSQEDIGTRIIEPPKLAFHADGRVDYSFSYLAGDREIRTRQELFWRIEDRNLIYSDTPKGEPSMTGGVITKISTRSFEVYTTKSTFGRYFRLPKRKSASI
jgi:hypothetical protein